VGEDTSCADGLRNLQSIKEKPIEDLLLGFDFWKHLAFHHQWLRFPQLSVCFALFGLQCTVDTPPSRNPPSLFAYFFNADVSKDGRFQDPSTPTNEPASQPSTQSICLSPKLQHQCINVAQATLAAKVFFLYRQELPAVPPATPRLDCGTDE